MDMIYIRSVHFIVYKFYPKKQIIHDGHNKYLGVKYTYFETQQNRSWNDKYTEEERGRVGWIEKYIRQNINYRI